MPNKAVHIHHLADTAPVVAVASVFAMLVDAVFQILADDSATGRSERRPSRGSREVTSSEGRRQRRARISRADSTTSCS
ncbi:hypothetical protein Micbo1qcDRAFT_20661 [Microdochium bolleyi]|uniref:Uncharacterized protein n=1 Tax=Microdochium bolleyi TaxID=196109 RepID=A0A136IHX0_9PEZI|nr:hypothetical protein Micbo1qcDRAFT_20661 [Microdochium bolleyi]